MKTRATLLLLGALFLTLTVQPGLAATGKKTGSSKSSYPLIESDPDKIAPVVKLSSYSSAITTLKAALVITPAPLPSAKVAGKVRILSATYAVKVPAGAQQGQWYWPKLEGVEKLPPPFVQEEPPAIPYAVDFRKLRGLTVSDKNGDFQGYVPLATGTCTAYWIIPEATEIVGMTLNNASPITVRLRAGTATFTPAPKPAPAAPPPQASTGTGSSIFERLRAEQQARGQSTNSKFTPSAATDSLYERLRAEQAAKRQAGTSADASSSLYDRLMPSSGGSGTKPASTPPAGAPAKQDATPAADTAKKAAMPAYEGELRGAMEVRVRNPNEFAVQVGLRSGGKGKDFTVGANEVKSVRVPNGRFDIYFQYSTDPDGLYQGDGFTLENNGVEIQIVKVVNGNYGIRKVR